MDKSSSLGMPLHPKTYSRGTSVKDWGCPRHPLFINKATGHLSMHYCAIFLLLHILCVVLRASFFCFFLFCFVCCSMCWIPAHFFWRKTRSILIAQNALVFVVIVLRVFQFSSTAFSSCSFTRIMFRARQYSLFMYDQLSGP